MTRTYAMLAGAWCLFGIMIVVALNARRRSRRVDAELGQWSKEEIERLKNTDWRPIVYNRIKPKDGMT